MKLKIAIPENLSQITLGQYQEYMKVLETNKGDENADDFLNMKALEIFCGLNLSECHQLPIKNFFFALEHIERCFKEETPLIKSFSFKDPNGITQEMGFIPKLDDMSTGEYMDIDGYISDWSKMHRAMAVLYRPIRVKSGENYTIQQYEGTDTYCDAMKEMPIGIVFGAMVFFYRLGMKLLRNIPQYLERQKELSKTQKESLRKIGDGIHQSSLYAEATFSKLMKPQKFLYTKA